VQMNLQHDQLRLFGLDLTRIKGEVLLAWRGMLNWSVLSWLWPSQPVRLILPDGQSIACRRLSALPVGSQTSQLINSAKFTAVLLPEDIVLRKSWTPPSLTDAEIEAARGLLAQSVSPFPPGDLVWSVSDSEGGKSDLTEQIVLSSRALIAKHVELATTAVKLVNPEVWVTTPRANSYVLVKGFGEPLRQRRESVGKWINALLLCLVLVIAGAIVLTPTAQLYLRYLEAEQAMTGLQKKAAPMLQQRERLVQTADRLNELAKLTGAPVPPLQTLELITKALPDDTSLLSLQIQGDRVIISGQTGNAAALMKQLGSSTGMRDVTAPAPATKPLGATRETFGIAFVLDPTKKATP
jgi:general secretion pathway protein L